MTDQERNQVLKMVDEGKITPEEGLRLMRILEQRPAEEEVEVVEPAAGERSEAEPDPAIMEAAKKLRHLWTIPLWIGVGITVLGAVLMYWALQTSGINFWFYCAGLPFALGVLLIALAWASRSARWLFVNVEQKPGEKPRRIMLGFPLPLRLAAWFLRHFGHYIPDLKGTAMDEVVEAVEASASMDTPLIVNVEDDEDGERVQVYIG